MTTTTAIPDATPSPRRILVLASLLAVYVIWGSTYLALRWVVEVFPAMLAAGARYLVAGVALLAIGRMRGAAWPSRATWIRAIAPGALLFVVGNGFVSLAEREVSSSQAAIVCASMPLVTVVFGVFIGERPRPLEILGLLVGFSGVIVMTAVDVGHFSASSVLLLFAPVGWALGSLIARKRSLPSGPTGAALPMIWGGVLALALGAVTGERPVTGSSTPKAVFAFVYLIVFGSMIAFTAYAYLLRNARPSIATSYAYVNPVVATLLGLFVGGEKLGAHVWLGGALVTLGVAAITVRQRPSDPSPARRR